MEISKLGIEKEVLSAQEKTRKEVSVDYFATTAYSDCFKEILHLSFFYLANLFFAHVFKKSKIATAKPSHWAENVIFPKLLCSPRYFAF